MSSNTAMNGGLTQRTGRQERLIEADRRAWSRTNRNADQIGVLFPFPDLCSRLAGLIVMAKSSVAVRATRRVPSALPAGSASPRASAQSATMTNLTESDLEVIWKTYKKTRDENLRNTLIEHHMPLVRAIAERVLQTLPKSIDVDDLSSAGTFGLMDAINGFDLSRGIKFKTYCTTRI
ncbi:MAG: hypothetical protein KDB62_10460, partial [Solirubrobacterales bacterium]|nr:hypothetical protein [Solirubrobacterales bacterium]